MCTDNSRAFAWLPFPSYSKGNETASIAAHEIFSPALDFVVPGFPLGKFSESSFKKDGLRIGHSMKGSRGLVDEVD